MIAETAPAGAWASLAAGRDGDSPARRAPRRDGDRRRSGFGRYAAFVGTGIALSLVTLALFDGVWRGDSSFLETLWLAFAFGSVAWVPVALFALVPGWFVFRAIRGDIRGRWPVNLLGTALGALAVSAVGALGSAAVASVTFGAVGGFGFFAVALFAFGAPASVLAGLLVYAGEDRDGA